MATLSMHVHDASTEPVARPRRTWPQLTAATLPGQQRRRQRRCRRALQRGRAQRARDHQRRGRRGALLRAARPRRAGRRRVRRHGGVGQVAGVMARAASLVRARPAGPESGPDFASCFALRAELLFYTDDSLSYARPTMRAYLEILTRKRSGRYMLSGTTDVRYKQSDERFLSAPNRKTLSLMPGHQAPTAA